jgi:hypothetical protein
MQEGTLKKITSQEAAVRKREVKRAGPIIEKGVDISNDLLDVLPSEVITKLSRMLGSPANTRDLFSAAVSSFLPEIVAVSLRAGIRTSSSGKQRPRKFDSVAWQALEAAEAVTGLSKVQLLRACLHLLAEKGLRRVDLQASLDEITKMGPYGERCSPDK